MQLAHSLILVCIFLSTSICHGQTARATYNNPDIPINASFFMESFETHVPKNDEGSYPFNLSGTSYATVSTEIALEGSKSILSHIPLTPNIDARSELRHKGGIGSPEVIGWQHRPFTTRTFLFSCFFPEDMVFDPVEETIMQWKNQTDDGCDVGNPPFSIRISDDNLKYSIKYDSAKCTQAPPTVFGTFNKSLTRGVWHHFVVEINYDYRISDTKGHVKIWYSEDDPVTIADSVLNYQGPVGYNDKLWPYLKVGLYKSEWHTQRNRQLSANAGVTERKMWIDQVGIIDGPWKPGSVNKIDPDVPKDSIRYSMNKPFVWPRASLIEGETIKMTVSTIGNKKYTHQWYKNGDALPGATSGTLTLQDVKLSDAGTYQVKTSDEFNSVWSEQVKISVEKKIDCSTLQVGAELTHETCNGNDGAIDLQISGGTAPYTYTWSNSRARASLSNLSAGSYTVQVTDYHGCVAEKTFAINAIPGPTKPVIAYEQGFLQVKKVSGATYQWYLDGSKIDESSVEELAVSQSGEYYVTVVDKNGCSAVSDNYIVDAPTNAIQQTVIQDLKLFPVPTSTELTIDLKLGVSAANTSYQISALDGNLLVDRSVGQIARSSSINIDVDTLAPGVYILKLKVLNEVVVRRFIKS
jgi:hypothetical protein